MADANVVLTSVAISGTTVGVINWLKRSKYFPWITKEKIILLRFLSAASATAAGVGIHWVWSTAADHSYSFAVTGITMATVLAFIKAIWVQFVGNEVIFQATKPQSNPAVVEAVAPQAAIQQGIVPEKK